eukprot:79267-Hanusia_phi.AAC.1
MPVTHGRPSRPGGTISARRPSSDHMRADRRDSNHRRDPPVLTGPPGSHQLGPFGKLQTPRRNPVRADVTSTSLVDSRRPGGP